MEKCDVYRVALNDNDYPYVLPLNYTLKLVMPHTKVFKLVVENVTGKVRMKKKESERKENLAAF